MKRKLYASLLITTVVAVSMTVGAYAATNLQKIEAYLNKGVAVIVNDKVLSITDAAGKPTSPITYNGTTYLPVRSVGNAVGYSIDFDTEENAVLLDGQRTQAEILAEIIEYGGTSLTYTNENKKLLATVEYDASKSEMGSLDLLAVFSVLLEYSEAEVFHIDYYEDNQITGTMTIERSQYQNFWDNMLDNEELSNEDTNKLFQTTGVLVE